jgi:hypothetical protein
MLLSSVEVELFNAGYHLEDGFTVSGGTQDCAGGSQF